MNATDPLSGPFPSSADLTGYSDEPGYAKLPSDAPSGYDFTARVLARLGPHRAKGGLT